MKFFFTICKELFQLLLCERDRYGKRRESHREGGDIDTADKTTDLTHLTLLLLAKTGHGIFYCT